MDNLRQTTSHVGFWIGVAAMSALVATSNVLVQFPINDSLRQRANAQNVSFGISLRWPTYIINSVDKTKLSLCTLASLMLPTIPSKFKLSNAVHASVF